MENQKIEQLLTLARELHAEIKAPAGVHDFATNINCLPGIAEPFRCNAYVGDKGFDFICAQGATPEEALANLAAKVPPPVTALFLREKAAALLQQASQMEAAADPATADAQAAS